MNLLRLSLIATFSILLLSSISNAQDPEGRLFGLTSSEPAQIYSINPNTGQAALYINGNGGSSIVGLSFVHGTPYGSDLYDFPGAQNDYNVGSFAPNGVITFLNGQNGSANWQGLASNDCEEGVLYSMDNEDNEYPLIAQGLDGSTTTIGNTFVDLVGLAYDDANNILYGIEEGGNLYIVSVETAAAQLIGPTGMPDNGNRYGLAYDEINEILYAVAGDSGEGSNQLYTVNTDTGVASFVGTINVDDTLDGLAWRDDCGFVRTVPTLSEWGLIAMAGLIGLIGLYAISRKRALA